MELRMETSPSVFCQCKKISYSQISGYSFLLVRAQTFQCTLWTLIHSTLNLIPLFVFKCHILLESTLNLFNLSDLSPYKGGRAIFPTKNILKKCICSKNRFKIELEGWNFYSGSLDMWTPHCKKFSPLAPSQGGFRSMNFIFWWRKIARPLYFCSKATLQGARINLLHLQKCQKLVFS